MGIPKYLFNMPNRELTLKPLEKDLNFKKLLQREKLQNPT